VVLVLCALVALAARSGLHGSVLNPRGRVTGTATQPLPISRPPAQGAGTSVALPPWIGWAALGLVAALLLAFVIRHLPALRLSRGTVQDGAGEEEDVDFRGVPTIGEEEMGARQEALRQAVLRSLEEVRADPDARRAIIGAYRLMEAALARTGLPRGPAEAPREYLSRALSALRLGPEAPRRLTILFERARFDDDELDLSLRDEAVAALLDLQRAL